MVMNQAIIYRTSLLGHYIVGDLSIPKTIIINNKFLLDIRQMQYFFWSTVICTQKIAIINKQFISEQFFLGKSPRKEWALH
jgi:hypothetical protein